MITIDQQEIVKKEVLARVKKLQPNLVDKYFNAVTPWLIRNVLECAEQGAAPDVDVRKRFI